MNVSRETLCINYFPGNNFLFISTKYQELIYIKKTILDLSIDYIL